MAVEMYSPQSGLCKCTGDLYSSFECLETSIPDTRTLLQVMVRHRPLRHFCISVGNNVRALFICIKMLIGILWSHYNHSCSSKPKAHY